MSNNTHAKELVRLRTGREVGDLLRELYIERRYSQEEVATALGVGRETAVRWMAEYGIHRADRAPASVEGIQA